MGLLDKHEDVKRHAQMHGITRVTTYKFIFQYDALVTASIKTVLEILNSMYTGKI